ncbi:tetraketide alpha-pyrone reductase 2-like [Silene latifolia]|uniref:tetraketide alpha-pyrone reductase 2-like n=1 Tax=Silene latifolia TaxID=37657 RepID=UPI003D78AB08
MEGAKERLRLFQANLTVDGSFDEAIQGAYGVFHVASPVLLPRPNDDVQALIIDPTVKGTKNVLNSCLKSTTLKRIVLTCSCYAINQRDDAHQISVCNESHWSDLEYCKRNNMWYAYAKTVAEEMAWKTTQENGLDLVVVHPSFVIGPLLNQQPSSTLKFLLDLIKGSVSIC